MENELQLQYSEEFKEFLASKMDYEEGQVILTERPLFTLPNQNCSGFNSHCCLTCLKVLKTGNMCSECKWPVCNPECEKDELHKAECMFFTKNGIEYEDSRKPYLKFVRILLARGSPEFNNFMKLPSDIEGRRGRSVTIVKKKAKEAFDFLRNECQMDATFEDVLKILSIIKLNYFSFEFADPAGNTYVGYIFVQRMCKISHSCAPNVEWAVVQKSGCEGNNRWELQVYTKSKIKRGDMLSIRYSTSGTFVDTCRRRKELLSVLPFDCLCRRCKDPREAGIYFGSTICKTCLNGNTLPTVALESDRCDWKCDECSHCLPAEEIIREVAILEDEVNAFARMKSDPIKMEMIEQFIERNAGKTLHKNHFVLFKAYMFWLFQSDFTRVLVEKDYASWKLFTKITYRADRVRYIATKLLPSRILVDLEFFMAQKTVEFVFRSSDLLTVKCTPNEPRKLYFAEIVLSHLTKSLQWAELNSQHGNLVNTTENLRVLKAAWTTYVKYLSGESNASECQIQEIHGHLVDPMVVNVRLIRAITLFALFLLILYLMSS